MSEFKTYRVRYCEWQTFAINVSARDATHACDLAKSIRREIGQHYFEELDGDTGDFQAEELDARDTPDDDLVTVESATRLCAGQGGAS